MPGGLPMPSITYIYVGALRSSRARYRWNPPPHEGDRPPVWRGRRSIFGSIEPKSGDVGSNRITTYCGRSLSVCPTPTLHITYLPASAPCLLSVGIKEAGLAKQFCIARFMLAGPLYLRCPAPKVGDLTGRNVRMPSSGGFPQATSRDGAVGLIELDSEEAPAQLSCSHQRGAGTAERIENDVS